MGDGGKEGGRERQSGGLGVRGRGEEALTFGTLPESVGFHAEGGAETFFIV